MDSSLIALLLISLGGFLLALYIFRTKRSGRRLLCPIGTDCDVVVRSSYSRFFGIPVELAGMMYYVVLVLGSAMLLLFSELLVPVVIRAILSFATLGFLFSLYLTSIQMFILKHWCTWCLISSGFSVAIFVLALRLS